MDKEKQISNRKIMKAVTGTTNNYNSSNSTTGGNTSHNISQSYHHPSHLGHWKSPFRGSKNLKDWKWLRNLNYLYHHDLFQLIFIVLQYEILPIIIKESNEAWL